MPKRRAKKVGSTGASSNEHIEISEPQVPEYERLRMLRIKQNESILQSLGLEEKAKSYMALFQTNKRKNHRKGEQKNSIKEDELYKSDEDVDVEDELDYSDEELSIGENSSNPRSKSLVRKFGNLKKRMPKTKAMAMAFKKQQQKLHILTRGKRIKAPECEEGNSIASALLCTNETNKENDNNTKPKRGPTMCYKIHGRSEEERLEIILNEHGQPIEPDNNTLNEFSSFLGTIARKANLLPLTVKNWPTFKNDKREELWDYVKKHYVVPIEGKKWVLQTIGACWRCYTCSLKRRHFRKFENDEMRMKKRPKNVPKMMFKELLKFWHSEEHKKISAKNTMNRLVGKKKNIMPTTGPKSFARVREEWKKERKTTRNPTLAEMFIATRKEKRTKL